MKPSFVLAAFVSLAALVAGCTTTTVSTTARGTSSGAPDDGTPSDGTPTDGTPDGTPGTSSGTTSSSGTTPTPAASGPCPSWMGPLVEGTRWQYYGSTTTNGATYTSTSTTTVGKVTKTADGATFTSETVTDATTSGTVSGTQKSTITSQQRCDAKGAWIVSQQSVTQSNYNNTVTNTTATTTYDGDGYLVVPPTLKAGDTWSRQVKGTTTTSGQAYPFAYGQSAVVKASGPVTVKAGTFQVLEVATTVTPAQGAPTTSSSFLAEGVGAVKTSSSELVSKSF